MYRGAVLNHDRNYRYQLIRIWDSQPSTVGCLLLNPRKADEKEDDVTGRRCIRAEGFEIANEDRKSVTAEARIDGDAVVVRNNQVPPPMAVRDAWRNNPDCNLNNKAGSPASSFRTDNLPPETGAN